MEINKKFVVLRSAEGHAFYTLNNGEEEHTYQNTYPGDGISGKYEILGYADTSEESSKILVKYWSI